MTRTRKLLLSGGAGLAGLCLLLVVCAVLVVRSNWFTEQVRERIVSEVEAATGGRAEIGEFRFDWGQLRAEIESFVLHGTEKPGEKPLFRARSVQIGLKIISIFQRDVDIDLLTINEPSIRVVVYEDGRTNLPQPKVVRQRRNPMEQVIALAIGRFRVDKGLLEINQRQIPLDVRGENLTARVRYDAAGQRYRGDVSFRQLRLTAPSLLPVALDADLALDLEANRLVFRAARFAASKSSVQATGAIDDLLSPRVKASFDAKLSLEEMRSILKLPDAVQGMLNLTGTLSYAGPADYALLAKASGPGLSAELDVRPGRVSASRLAVSALGGAFSGRAEIEKLNRFRLAGDLRGVSILEVAKLRKIQLGPWSGRVSGPIEIEGRLESGRPSDVKATGKLTIEASDQTRPVEGLVDLTYDQRAETLEFGNSHLSTRATRLRFSGAPDRRLQVDLESTNLNDFQPPVSLPIALNNGSLKFSGTVTGGLDNPRASGHVLISNFSSQGQVFDRLEADVVVSAYSVEASRFVLDQGGTRLQGQGRATLRDWKPDEAGPASGSFSLRGLPLEKVLAQAGSQLPIGGLVSGTFQVAGTPRAPEVTAKLTLAQAVAYGQRLDQGRAQLRYAGALLTVESFDLNSGPAELRGSAVLAPGGSVKLDVSGKGFRLESLPGLPEGLQGTLDLQARGEASVNGAKILPTGLWGKFSFRNLTFDKKPAGELQLTADTQNGSVFVDGVGQIAGAPIKGQARCRLQSNYPVEGELSFARTSSDALRPLLASAEGKVSFKGAGLDPGSWTGRVEMPIVEILPPPDSKTQALSLHNDGAVVLALSRKEIRIQAARFAGPDTSLEATGLINLGTQSSAYDVRIRGSINLAILHNFDTSLTATGESALDATVRGPQSRPEIYGRLDLKKASFSLSGVPNGIENANGVIFLFRDRATIENVTAETGGGKLALSGFVGFGGERLSYRLHATASHVRVRYPEGFSTTMDAAIDLTGAASRSLLSGTVSVLRSALSPTVDFAGLLTRSSQPMITPATQNELLRGMQFDVRVETAPNARFDTMLTRDVQAEAILRLRGTPYRPVLLGRISINQGEVNFLGNRYTISRGEISSINPVRFEPVLNLDLETRVRGVDVTLNFTGPPDRLNVTYRSDPPLQINEIVALLAVGRAPTSDPALLVRQSERDQNWQQIGASTLVGQALAAPLANRLQRFFGVSRIKIDPKLTGLGNNPEAQLTLEQQVSKDITFTYVTSLAQEQQQLIRVEWNVSRQWSLLAVREENGLFGIEVQFKKQFK